MIARETGSWQLILADLALILFMVAVVAIADETEDDDGPSGPPPQADVPAQALYRPRAGAPTIDAWLTQQNPGEQMSLTIVATHRADEALAAWNEANALAQAARTTGIAVRIVLREGAQSDLYASLGYDEIE